MTEIESQISNHNKKEKRKYEEAIHRPITTSHLL